MESIRNNTLGNNLRNARIKRGMSQDELAKAIGVTKAAVSRYESGTREPRGDQLKQIARVLNVTVAYLEGIEVVDIVELHDAFKRKDYRAVEQIMDLPTHSLEFCAAGVLEDIECQVLSNSASELNIVDIATSIREHFGEFTTADFCDVNSMIKYLSMLNEKGRSEAVFRVEELTEIPKYKKEKPPQV